MTLATLTNYKILENIHANLINILCCALNN